MNHKLTLLSFYDGRTAAVFLRMPDDNGRVRISCEDYVALRDKVLPPTPKELEERRWYQEFLAKRGPTLEKL